MTDRFYLGLLLALIAFSLIFLLAPLLRLLDRQRKRKKFEAWYEAGPKLEPNIANNLAFSCNFCGGRSVKKTLLGSYPRKDLLRKLEHQEVDEARFFEYRCAKCGSLIYKERQSLFDPKPVTSRLNEASDFEHAKSWFISGLKAMEGRSYEQAEIDFEKSLELVPDRSSTLVNLAAVRIRLKKFEGALQAAAKAVAIEPINHEGWFNRGVASAAIHENREAETFYRKAIQIKPDYFEAHLHLGDTLIPLSELDEALLSYNNALRVNPNSVQALFNTGRLLYQLRRFDESITAFKKVIKINPNFPFIYNNLGVVFQEKNKIKWALKCFDKEILTHPDNPEAYNNRANIFRLNHQYDLAFNDYTKAIELDPKYEEAMYNLGILYCDFHRFGEALNIIQELIELQPKNADALRIQGNILKEQGGLKEALASFDDAFDINPNLDYLLGDKLQAQLHLCEWSGFGGYLQQMITGVDKCLRVANPFHAISLIDDPWNQLRVAKIYADDNRFLTKTDKIFDKPVPPKKIRIGYYSPDFISHPVAFLCSGLFESHDRDKFQVYAFSMRRKNDDIVQQRLMRVFDDFIDVSDMSNQELVRKSKEIGIDIAVDLAGHTAGARPECFAKGLAPIQINYLGYPGTSGMDSIDYIIADREVIPNEYRSAYSENIIYLPYCFQVNDNSRNFPSRAIDRKSLGLPEDQFIFCCLNNISKINPTMFSSWMRILHQTEGTVLWLVAEGEATQCNLKAEAIKQGVNPSRILITKRLPLEDYRSSLASADLFLDTLPFNAGTTASDALWAGLPLLTCQGKSFAARMASSILRAADLGDLVTTNMEEYETLAIELANNPQRLANLRGKLASGRTNVPLFNTQQTTSHIEQAFETIYQRWLRGEPPQDLSIPV